jgi:hypothetical protein
LSDLARFGHVLPKGDFYLFFEALIERKTAAETPIRSIRARGAAAWLAVAKNLTAP